LKQKKHHITKAI